MHLSQPMHLSSLLFKRHSTAFSLEVETLNMQQDTHSAHKVLFTSVHLIQSFKDPTLWHMNFAVSAAPDGSLPIAGIVWCCSPSGVASSFAPVLCWLRPGHGVVTACVVLFQAQCAVVEGIVLSSRGHCPSLMYVCLFML